MRTQMPLVILLFVTISAGSASDAQVGPPITSNPIPVPITKRGLTVEIRDVARLPDTRGLRPPDQDVVPAGWARVSFVRDLADGRRFVNDSRGMLYLLDRNNQPSLYANVGAAFPFAIYTRLESGFIGFDFHPDFATNGLFYTVHGERAAGNPATPNFIPPGFTPADTNHHNVITEWHATNPAANTFEGTRRELLRVGQVVTNLTHPMGDVEFNPTAKRGAPDYGLLYTSGSDMGFSNGGGPNASNPGQTQRLDSVVTAILRIDPRSPSVSGGAKGLGDYTIPSINRFAADGDPKTLGEIYAYGFRNAHRLSWDLTDGTMFASDIGMNNIEEINIVHEGNNYGWMKREGLFENGVTRPGGALNQLFPLAPDILDGRTKDGFAYPVTMYDHSEGQAVSGGFAYHGRIPALRGKFVFGDIVRGRLFVADLAAMKKADDGIPQTVAPVEEIQLTVRDQGGNRTYVTLRELIEAANGATAPRADLHISRSRDGELFITSRQDGVIRMLVPDSTGTAPSGEPQLPTEGPAVAGSPAWFLQGSFPDPTGRAIVDPTGRVTVPPRDGGGARGAAGNTVVPVAPAQAAAETPACRRSPVCGNRLGRPRQSLQRVQWKQTMGYTFTYPYVLPPGFGGVPAVALDSKGNLWAFQRADAGRSQLFKFDPNYRLILQVGADVIGYQDKAHGMAVDAEDNVWITAANGATVMKVSPAGKLLLTIGEPGRRGDWNEAKQQRLLWQPVMIAFAPNGDVYIAEGHANESPNDTDSDDPANNLGAARIIRLDKNGKFISQWYGNEVGQGKFSSAHGLAVDPTNGDVWIGDREEYRIVVYSGDGQFVKTMQMRNLVCALYFDSHSQPWMATGQDGQFLKLDRNGKVLGAIGNGMGIGTGQFTEASYWAMDKQDNLYAGDTSVGRITKMAAPKN